MQDKEKLNKLLDILEELLKIEGNEWLIDAVLEKIRKVSTLEEIASHSIIKDIYEYCVEKIINKQAEEFYADFTVEAIKDQLIRDFIKMEHERRRDDFESFSLCLFQQLENITNYVYENEIRNIWKDEKNKTAVQYFDRNKNQEIKKSVEAIVFGNAKDWYVNVKFKALLYFVYFNKSIKSQFPFNKLVESFNEVYQIRNQNHRGNNPTEYQQRTILKMKGKESHYYFRFYGFLQDVVSKVSVSDIQNDTVKNSNKLIRSVKKVENKKNNPNPKKKNIGNPPVIQDYIDDKTKKKHKGNPPVMPYDIDDETIEKLMGKPPVMPYDIDDETVKKLIEVSKKKFKK